eukprot:758314-Hanusia_phi.AAC.12
MQAEDRVESKSDGNDEHDSLGCVSFLPLDVGVCMPAEVPFKVDAAEESEGWMTDTVGQSQSRFQCANPSRQTSSDIMTAEFASDESLSSHNESGHGESLKFNFDQEEDTRDMKENSAPRSSVLSPTQSVCSPPRVACLYPKLGDLSKYNHQEKEQLLMLHSNPVIENNVHVEGSANGREHPDKTDIVVRRDRESSRSPLAVDAAPHSPFDQQQKRKLDCVSVVADMLFDELVSDSLTMNLRAPTQLDPSPHSTTDSSSSSEAQILSGWNEQDFSFHSDDLAGSGARDSKLVEDRETLFSEVLLEEDISSGPRATAAAVLYAAELLDAVDDRDMRELKELDVMTDFLNKEKKLAGQRTEAQQIFHKLLFDLMNEEIRRMQAVQRAQLCVRRANGVRKDLLKRAAEVCASSEMLARHGDGDEVDWELEEKVLERAVERSVVEMDSILMDIRVDEENIMLEVAECLFDELVQDSVERCLVSA